MKFRKIILLTIFFATLLTSLFSQNIYLLVLLSICSVVFLPFKRFWDAIAIALLVFSFFYTTMVVLKGEIKSGFVALSYLITPVSLYRLGLFLMDEFKDEKSRLRLIFCMVSAYLLNVFVLTLVDLSIVGIVNEDRTLLGYSTSDDALAATLYGLMTSVGIGCLGAAFAKRMKILPRLLYSILVLMSLLVVVHLINRTGLVIAIVCLLVTLLYRENFKIHRIILVFCILALLAFGLFASGAIDYEVLEAYQKREVDASMGIATAGGRTQLWLDALSDMFMNPLGWEQRVYAHNMWLDIAKVAGWFAIIPFLVATYFYLKKLWKLMRARFSNIALLLISLNVSMLLAASVEPVLEGSMLFFGLLMCMWGMAVSLSNA